MPASFGLECPHLHCIRVHNKRPQTPTSFMCKSTIKDMCAPRRYTRPSLHAPRGACIFLARIQELPVSATSCTRWQDTRAGPYACIQRCTRHLHNFYYFSLITKLQRSLTTLEITTNSTTADKQGRIGSSSSQFILSG